VVRKITPNLIQQLKAGNNDNLRHIMSRVKLLQRLQLSIEKYLEPTQKLHVHVANYRQGCLVLQTANAAIATKLRFQIPQLLQSLRQDEQLPGLANIKIIVRPESKHSVPTANPARLSQKASEVLKQTADIISDPKLRHALEKLGGQ